MLETIFLIINGVILYWLIKPTKGMIPRDLTQDDVDQQVEVASLNQNAKVYDVDTASLKKSTKD
ncbi:hypothetical protein [Pseudalkalibacillus berkeleyi]|uniref:Uncharacterized protein n=1 Tax=Pseudalkalibacillus berkeleyi TaxID=1069813 RepID=A0ABS9GZ14_9BACL|nr:hypothetical protein [Pseudalkalibacillus berkeleyi]MCF6136630.1 hypothetical protein [Pseudalkalibacillus berkeleyi]